MSDETVAAVIPTMDRPDRVRNAVESVIDQTYTHIEIVVVDDSTGDETAAIVDNLRKDVSEKELMYISNSEPRGVSAARNQAISVTDADYIAFLDDDDLWEPRKTETQLSTFRDGPESLAAVYCGFKSVSDTGNHLHTKVPEHREDIFEELLIKDVVGPPSTMMIRRNAIEDVGGFNEEYQHHEDWELYLRLAEKYDFDVNPEALTTRTIHDDATSNEIRAALKHRERIISSRETELYDNDLYDSAWAAHYRKSGVMACRHGEIKKGRRFFRNSVSHRPRPSVILLYISTLFGKYGFESLRALKRLANTKLSG
jgi:glycosyltransferase involved in cell wall biosynthesis